MPKYTDIKMDCDRMYFYLSCICNGFHYHILLDRETRTPKTIRSDSSIVEVFKNTLAKRGEPGYLECRHLTKGSKFCLDMIDYMLAYAHNHKLYDKAIQDAAQRDEKEQHDNWLKAKAYAQENHQNYVNNFTPFEPKSDDEIGKRILRHAADYLYVQHGQEKSRIDPNCITFYDRKAEVLGLAMQEIQFAMQRINNSKELN